MQTPWGKSDHKKILGEGVVFYGTPSHGGIKLSAARLAQMPDYLRGADAYADGNAGWFEEDCAWSLVAIVFPDLFDAEALESAKSTFRNHYPDEYERHYGVTLKPGESYTRDEKLFHEKHASDYLVLSCFGDWHKEVPKGFVGVFAGKGGRTANGHYPEDTRWFLVPDAEYKPKMVIGVDQYPEIKPLA